MRFSLRNFSEAGFRWFLAYALLVGLVVGATYSRAQVWQPWTHGTPAATGALPITIVQHNIASSGTGAQTTWNVSLPSASAVGNLFTLELYWYKNAISQAVTSLITNNSTTCTAVSGTSVDDGNERAVIYYCANNAANVVVTFTVNWGGNVGYPAMLVQEWAGASTASPDVGIGQHGNGTGVATISVTTNGNTGQANQLLVSMVGPSTSAATSVGGSQTALEGNSASYQTASANGVPVQHTYNFAASQNMVAAIAAFKHP